ncbi:FAD-dependent monooxygenase [Hansschlegelia quercus]|uniref:FAD-binding monooxygenase n=1 Tax=Hansschlegelia quercus TaxID=2528245 RepID=A0A4Q9GIX6_9HYPH|nr:FAD-dependent monooxygenase [Hansschlegelia quercus]TBN54183.1 FAD-binding monooxygenase [Hansschlegelia quercus]
MARDVLITGASVAGPALAWWLGRYGMNVTVVERAPEFRDNGQNVDIRGAGRVVAQRMGIEDEIAARTTGEKAIAFVDEKNEVQAQIDVGDFGAGGPTAELEILRGDLSRILVERSRDKARYQFGDRITALDDGPDGVDVTFEKGGRRRFDLVIAAEGIGSATRTLVFGDEARRKPLDLYMGYFSIPPAPTDSEDTARWFNAPAGRSVFLRPGGDATHVVLTAQQPPDGREDLEPSEQKAWLRKTFADAGWEIARVLDGLDKADDFYFEAIGQVKMDRWSKGRVALLGDAAYCASPISGMGTSLALVGAYVLAGELSRHEDHEAAFAAYERIMRPYVEQAQNVPKLGPRIAQPQTRFGIALQQWALDLSTKPLVKSVATKLMSSKPEKIDLPNYGYGVDAGGLKTPAVGD